MEKAMLSCGLNVCNNDSMSLFEGCPNNELLELLKKKKEHARLFLISRLIKSWSSYCSKNHYFGNKPFAFTCM